jgi:hypothetical protein
MADLDALLTDLGTRFGVLAESNTYQLTVIAHNSDVAVGDLFLLPCKRGPHRFYIFRTTHLQSPRTGLREPRLRVDPTTIITDEVQRAVGKHARQTLDRWADDVHTWLMSGSAPTPTS